jgi:hypothetical protein
VLLLLPPSEGKTGPESGPKFNASKLGYPGLKNTRSAVLNALISLCAKNPGQAATVIGLGPKQRELAQIIEKVGYQLVEFRNQTFGIVAIHTGQKPKDS